MLAGEFTRVNKTAQQGLVRFGIAEKAPNAVGPAVAGAAYKPSLSSPAAGLVRGSIPANYDYDNELLTYQSSAQASRSRSRSETVRSTFFNRPTVTFNDSTVEPGETYRYRVQVADPFGNTAMGEYVPVTVATEGSISAYGLQVLDDALTAYWRLGEPSGNVAIDWAAGNNGQVNGTVTRGQESAIVGDGDFSAGPRLRGCKRELTDCRGWSSAVRCRVLDPDNNEPWRKDHRIRKQQDG